MNYTLCRIGWALCSLPYICQLKILNGKRARVDWIEHIERFARITIAKGKGYIRLGKGSHLKKGVELLVSGDGILDIGQHVYINSNSYIAAQEKVIIGDYCKFGPNVIIVDHDHDFRTFGGLKANKYKTTPVHIGTNVWIGANTVILRGSEIGNNSVIGAGCVISGKYPDSSVIIQKRSEIVSSYMEEGKFV